MRKPQVPGVWRGNQTEGQPSMKVGIVTNVNPAIGTISVRLTGQFGETIKDVLIPEDATLFSGDRVLLVRSSDQSSWIAVTRIIDTDEYGLKISQSHGENEIHPPENLSVSAAVGLVIATWDAWPGRPVCWNVQWNSLETDSGAESTYTFGSNLIIVCPDEPTLKYVRVRAVRYDVKRSLCYYSGWSAWGSATSLVYTVPQLTCRIDGPLVAIEDVYTYIAAGNFVLDAIYIYCDDPGSAGTTIVDVHLNGTTVFTTQASRPQLDYDDANGIAVSGTPDVTTISKNNKLSIDIDQVATGARGLSVNVGMVGLQ